MKLINKNLWSSIHLLAFYLIMNNAKGYHEFKNRTVFSRISKVQRPASHCDFLLYSGLLGSQAFPVRPIIKKLHIMSPSILSYPTATIHSPSRNTEAILCTARALFPHSSCQLSIHNDMASFFFFWLALIRVTESVFEPEASASPPHVATDKSP